MYKYYAGIGSRETPSHILQMMTKIAKILDSKGCILRSGGANGADLAFENGSSNKEIYLPWRAFNNNDSPLYHICNESLQLAKTLHPSWSRLNQAGRKLMARNCYQILGSNLNKPVDFVICYTKDGKASGGTGQAIRLAKLNNIPVYNLFNNEDFNKLNSIL